MLGWEGVVFLNKEAGEKKTQIQNKHMFVGPPAKKKTDFPWRYIIYGDAFVWMCVCVCVFVCGGIRNARRSERSLWMFLVVGETHWFD